jgi:hypothetical protein
MSWEDFNENISSKVHTMLRPVDEIFERYCISLPLILIGTKRDFTQSELSMIIVSRILQIL